MLHFRISQRVVTFAVIDVSLMKETEKTILNANRRESP